MKKLLLLIPVLIATPLYSQVERPIAHMSLDELMKIDVVGSTLTSENLMKVPSSATVFTHEEIKRMGLDTLDELMVLVPGKRWGHSLADPSQAHLSLQRNTVGDRLQIGAVYFVQRRAPEVYVEE
jgi:hypothetical protein